MSASNRRNLYILAFTLVIMMLGLGVVIPIMPFYVENLGAGGTELGLLAASYAAMRLIFGPVWGGLSDRYGRKPILMIGVLGYGIAMILFGISTRLWMLFASRILSGILSSATSPTTMAYIGDSTSPEERGRGMGLLGAAMGLGTILGPGLGGLLGGESLSLPFFIAGGGSFLALGLIALLLPESHPKAARQAPATTAESGRFKALPALLSGRVGALMFSAFLMTCGLMMFYGVFGLYALEKFGFGPKEVGAAFMVFGLVSALVQGALAGSLTERWGEINLILVSLPGAALGLILVTLADGFIPVLLAVGFFTLTTALLAPTVSALTSKWSPLEQGITMGWSNAFMSLGRIFGPLLAGILFDAHIESPYWGGAVILTLGTWLIWRGFRKTKS